MFFISYNSSLFSKLILLNCTFLLKVILILLSVFDVLSMYDEFLLAKYSFISMILVIISVNDIHDGSC